MSASPGLYNSIHSAVAPACVPLKYLEQLNKERGITVICSLHFLDLVHRYATTAIALKDGELVFQGLPKQIDDEQFKAIYGQEAERVSTV